MTVQKERSAMVSPLILFLLAGVTSTATGVWEAITVTEGGITFKVGHNNDNKGNPYRVILRQSGVKWNFKFNTRGLVRNIKTRSERYNVHYDSSDNLTEVERLTSSRRLSAVSDRYRDEDGEEPDGRRETVEGQHGRRLYACDDCAEAWDVVCGQGVASVCDLVGYGDPISSKAETAIQTLCVTFGSACSGNIATEACAGQCEVEDDDVDFAVNACLDNTNEEYRCAWPGNTTTFLDFEDCQLVDSDIPDVKQCFEEFGKTNIHEMTFIHNELTTLPEDMFDGLTELYLLELSQNNISSVPAGLFSGLNLQELSFDDTRMSSFPEGLFKDLPKLEFLYLSNSMLEDLREDTFWEVPTLRYLWLSNSMLGEIPLALFKGLTKLEELNLDYNGLTALSPGLFSDQASSMITLRFEYNNLTTLPDGIFEGFTSIVFLWLRFNTNLQCLPTTSAVEVLVGESLLYASSDPYGVLNGTCECYPEDAVMCEPGSTCQPGKTGYTCV